MNIPNAVRTLVVHEDPIVSAGLMAVLDIQPYFEVSSAPTMKSWLRAGLMQEGDVDVVVTDYQSGLDLLAALKGDSRCTRTPPPRVFIVTQHAREAEVRFAMNAGVFGYVLQRCDVDEIVTGVRQVGASRRYLSEEVAASVAESLTRVTLTSREADVLEFLQSGMCNKSIARELGIAPGTVKAHIRGIFEKLESTTRTQAVAIAARRGLIKQALPEQGTSIRRSDAASTAARVKRGEAEAPSAFIGRDAFHATTV